MNATVRFVVWGTMPIGGLVGGALGSWLGVRATMVVACVVLTLCVVPLLVSPLRRMRDLPEASAYS